MSDLNSAIQLIRQGQKETAQKILEPLLKAEPSNIQAWFWYVETCPTLEKRIQVLEVCLKMNPANAQVIQALQTLNSKRPTIEAPKEPQQTPSSYSVRYDDEKQKDSIPASSHPYFDEKPIHLNDSQQQSPSNQKKAWEDLNSYEDKSKLSKPKSATKSYAFYDVWLTVLTMFDIESYEDILNDPEAGVGRAFEWVAYAGIISGLLAPLSLISNPQFAELRNMPEFNNLFGNMGTTAFMVILAFGLALFTPIASVIGLAISAGIQNIAAGFFGGKGDYNRTLYAIAAYSAPITIIIALLGIIPVIGQCLSSLIGFYNIVLNVRALRAAHSISIGQALGAMFVPSIIVIILGCLLLFVVGVPGIASS